MFLIRPAVPVDCAGIALVQVDSYRCAYAGMFPPTYLEQFSTKEQEQDWLRLLAERPEDILLVAETPEHKITGYVLAVARSEIHPGYDAELVALHVNKAFQRGGAGRALVHRAVELLIERGCRSVMLWTLRGNPTRGWYERLGGECIGEKKDDIDGWTVVEVAYGWKNIFSLAAASASFV
jgi:ribosomal protein S18 acetylase RimI-like enzyme